MPAGRPKGSIDMPRQRMLRGLEEQYPNLNVICRIMEQAELARDDMAQRTEEYKRFRDHGEMPAVPDVQRGEGGELELAQQPQRVPVGERNMLTGMYEKAARFLLPQLKATEMAVGGLEGGGPVRVTFLREPPPEPEA